MVGGFDSSEQTVDVASTLASEEAYLLFQFCNTGFHGTQGVFDLGRRETGDDVLRAVPIVGIHVDNEEAFDRFFDFRIGEIGREGKIFFGFKYAGMAENFEPIPIGVIHQEQRHAVVVLEIPRGEELAIPTIVANPMVVGLSTFRNPGAPPRCWIYGQPFSLTVER